MDQSLGQNEGNNRLIHFERPITNQIAITQTDRKIISWNLYCIENKEKLTKVD